MPHPSVRARRLYRHLSRPASRRISRCAPRAARRHRRILGDRPLLRPRCDAHRRGAGAGAARQGRGAIESLSGVGSVTDATTPPAGAPPLHLLRHSRWPPRPARRLRALPLCARAHRRCGEGPASGPGGPWPRPARSRPWRAARRFFFVVIFALDALMRVQSGRITLSDDMLSIEGGPPTSRPTMRCASTMSEPLPQDFRLARFAVRPPARLPLSVSAAREGRAVVVRGHVRRKRCASRCSRPCAPPCRRPASPTIRTSDGAPSLDRWLAAVRFAANHSRSCPPDSEPVQHLHLSGGRGQHLPDL